MIWLTLAQLEGDDSNLDEKSRARRWAMPMIRHIAIASSNREKLAAFYKQAFGMKEVKGEGGAIYLSDGSINLASNEQYAGREAGLYHFGFEVEDLDALKKKLKEAGAGSEVQRRPAS
jgi:catechol-2,3-dioxygenase